ncbi:leucyl aminopeptidase [bacterium endosymbiont of Pedicinus badii]|uniref:leucyl aminopeptidase n=1 Tax=bacterium endosymbiont of Pedicinus badii TaxID=1719126 RepID=UPI0009BA0FFD|nr:leucyl aminopeptidase [bacterium endosymbiont of Pedicinus badii]OQM34138.1 hypothetical protein AOQ89_02235 [bacterium endosymbiont of Pedicinus badii]
MKFSLINKNDYSPKTDCIILGAFFQNKLIKLEKFFSKKTEDYINKIIQEKIYLEKESFVYHFYNPFLKESKNIILFFQKKNFFEDYEKEMFLKKIVSYLIQEKCKNAVFLLENFFCQEDYYWKIRNIIETIYENKYTFTKFKTKKAKKNIFLEEVLFFIKDYSKHDSLHTSIQHGRSISEGINITKDLCNTPPNICNPKYLSKFLKSIFEKHSKYIKIETLSEKEMKKIGMNAYIAVGKGSINESIMTIIHYMGPKAINKNPIVLVGKGVTFDSGGISLKPSSKMDEMKYDMSGASAVCGTIYSIVKMKLPIYVIGIVAGCENMIGKGSYRPGDIIKTMSGKTVEILNTDAEGRLVLCDALEYSKKFNPIVMIDIATLTGACVVALGKYFTGLISNSESLCKELFVSSKQTRDYVWRLPIIKQLKEEMRSNFADIANVGGICGAITAGYFLSCFTKNYKWAHLDIAGTAWKNGNQKGSTGRPVKLLVQFLLNFFYNNK